MDSDKASYKQKLDVLQQQQELIDDEAEQEQKEEDARRAQRESAELEARTAQSLLPDSEVDLHLAFSEVDISDYLCSSFLKAQRVRALE